MNRWNSSTHSIISSIASAFFLLFLSVHSVSGQVNLIYNPDFELYDSCPSGISSPGNPQIQSCSGWTMPTLATSDYFNTCTNMGVGIPLNFAGYQQTYSGNAYLGFYAFSNSTYPWYEYIQGHTTVPLVSGSLYKFSCRISRADAFEYAVSAIGICFSPNPISRNDTYPFMNVTPQIQNPLGQFISDTANWILIDGYFTAQGNERYITIGYFQDTLSTDYIQLYSVNNLFNSYYLIDSLWLTEVQSQLSAPNVFTPNNDGINDIFIIQSTNIIGTVSVYNRWGNQVASFSLENGWNGNDNSGQPCSEGVYYAYVNGTGTDKKKYNSTYYFHLFRN